MKAVGQCIGYTATQFAKGVDDFVAAAMAPIADCLESKDQRVAKKAKKQQHAAPKGSKRIKFMCHGRDSAQLETKPTFFLSCEPHCGQR